MNLEYQISFLKRTQNVLPSLVRDLTDEQFRWVPPSGNWSILEILGHMVIEETDDFRKRVQMTLEDAIQTWPDYDPEGIVKKEKFNEKVPREVLDQFLLERKQSLQWLSTLESPDWNSTYQHPRIGPLKAGDLFVSWVVHDQLHVRQIAKRCFELIATDGKEFSTRYAGEL